VFETDGGEMIRRRLGGFGAGLRCGIEEHHALQQPRARRGIGAAKRHLSQGGILRGGDLLLAQHEDDVLLRCDSVDRPERLLRPGLRERTIEPLGLAGVDNRLFGRDPVAAHEHGAGANDQFIARNAALVSVVGRSPWSDEIESVVANGLGGEPHAFVLVGLQGDTALLADDLAVLACRGVCQTCAISRHRRLLR
jgi:hypothetical protein